MKSEAGLGEAVTSNDARREIDRKVDVKFGRSYRLIIIIIYSVCICL